MLMKVKLSIITGEPCEKTFKSDVGGPVLEHGVVPSQVCAGELAGGKDTCTVGTVCRISNSNMYFVYKMVGYVTVLNIMSTMSGFCFGEKCLLTTYFYFCCKRKVCISFLKLFEIKMDRLMCFKYNLVFINSPKKMYISFFLKSKGELQLVK